MTHTLETILTHEQARARPIAGGRWRMRLSDPKGRQVAEDCPVDVVELGPLALRAVRALFVVTLPLVREYVVVLVNPVGVEVARGRFVLPPGKAVPPTPWNLELADTLFAL